MYAVNNAEWETGW